MHAARHEFTGYGPVLLPLNHKYCDLLQFPQIWLVNNPPPLAWPQAPRLVWTAVRSRNCCELKREGGGEGGGGGGEGGEPEQKPLARTKTKTTEVVLGPIERIEMWVENWVASWTGMGSPKATESAGCSSDGLWTMVMGWLWAMPPLPTSFYNSPQLFCVCCFPEKRSGAPLPPQIKS